MLNELNPNAELWVKALESGDYKQGKGRLCNENKYCCLGVACEVAIMNGVPITKIENAYLTSDSKVMFSSLPDAVKDWLNLFSITGNCSIGDLIYLNDMRGISFKEIAAFIRSKPKGLFRD